MVVDFPQGLGVLFGAPAEHVVQVVEHLRPLTVSPSRLVRRSTRRGGLRQQRPASLESGCPAGFTPVKQAILPLFQLAHSHRVVGRSHRVDGREQPGEGCVERVSPVGIGIGSGGCFGPGSCSSRASTRAINWRTSELTVADPADRKPGYLEAR